MTATLEFTVPKLACAVCVGNVTKAVQALDADATVDADPNTKQVKISPSAAFAATESVETALRDALTAAGYPPA